MKTCPKCGKTFEEGKFCRFCGSVLPDSAPSVVAYPDEEVETDDLQETQKLSEVAYPESVQIRKVESSEIEFFKEKDKANVDSQEVNLGETQRLSEALTGNGEATAEAVQAVSQDTSAANVTGADYEHVAPNNHDINKPQNNAQKSQNQSGPKNKKKNTGKICLIVAISVILVAAIIAVLVIGGVVLGVGVIFGVNSNKKVESEKVIISEQQEEFDYSESEVERITYDNIADDSMTLDDSELMSIKSRIDNKSSITSLNIKILITDDPSVEPFGYAESKCKSECGANGIYMVINSYNRVGAVATCGNGSKFMPDALKDEVMESVMYNLSAGDVYNACIGAVEMIPDSENDASLYNFKKVPGSQQVVYADSKKGTVTLIDWSGSQPQQLFKTSSVVFGMDGVTSSPSEYISATPKGTFPLGFAFSTHSLNTGLSTRNVTSRTVWVNDVDSEYYNTMQTGPTVNSPYWDSAEATYSYFTNGVYYACVLIEHNGDGYTKGVSGRGSAIFLSGKSSSFGTSYGDVNLTASDMKTLLAQLDESKNPYIVIT